MLRLRKNGRAKRNILFKYARWSILNIGFCSGKTIDRFLQNEHVEKVVTVDMNRTVLEAAERFFPDIYQRVMADSRSEVVIDEFRNFVRYLPDEVRFDVVVIDIAVDDPYYHGMFTRELFADLHRHLTPQGVLFIAKKHAARTIADVFEYAYMPRRTRFKKRFFFFTKERVPKERRKRFREVHPREERGLVYTDHEIYEVAANERAAIDARSWYLPRWARHALD